MMLQVQDLGNSSYKRTWELQKELQLQRIENNIDDTLLLVEHEPVYTFGKNADENHLLQNYPENVKLFYTERGGDITFHGPGQIVGYPIMDLHNYKMSISWYMRSLEEVIIRSLDKFGISADRKDSLTGVWVEDEKIAALGVRISRWVTMHGFALNVNTDLAYYDSIIPCGIFDYGITSMKHILGENQNISKIKSTLSAIFLDVFQLKKMEA
ncbi:MAG: lipoyl(octanoyl) transferase LipB [Candidatus Marinimicrobia bacterium]|jgi:lipoate-protein ligase B|nr:lipoyl(octanoyl) transferase LipB [Candidatus Neomarinimicrobiota bacterium]HJM48000.1 lipoyl(octanoyl) transferase LipB [Candidatus Neomarinimicrobiota bacterium]|tara:strand:- start:6825 stop:7460 length:636 start_codon:yes stop_codon:yes gene_type:complete